MFFVAVITVFYFSLGFFHLEKEMSKKSHLQNTKEMVTIKVYFSNSKKDPQTLECDKVYPVERKVPKTQTLARMALEELLKGPTQREKERGYFTNINPGVKIQSLMIKDGVVKVDFNKRLEYQVGGSCRVRAIRAQIIATLRQFPTVKKVIISVNGKTEGILQP